MEAFTILGDPVRRRILEHLCVQDLSSGEVVSSVGEEFGISQPAISQHLKVLRENNFANVRVDGARRIYSLEPSGLQDVDQWLAPFRRFWEPKLEALAKEVERGRKLGKQN
ncbi:MAG: metalloregulator ArsR/SmtB family transcription factor [Xanthomonadales bacterium]|nr:metalloregulator ArsR/SmtB family transcription factor [Xanthomonadales bacterium]